MKLSRLYSNLDHYFKPIEFNSGLNVILAEIRLPENKEKSSHNLGKSTLARVIDFCLLSGVGKDHFFRKRDDLFGEFVFFLELQLLNGSYLTIRRAVKNYSKISFSLSDVSQPDLTSLPKESWLHYELAFGKSKELLDGYLDLRDLDPWKFRNAMGYFLRTQADYDDVFKLKRHAGPDKDWKPILARVLGLQANIFSDRYDLKADIEVKSALLASAEDAASATDADPGQIDALIQLREAEIEQMKFELDGFDFEEFDTRKITSLVEDLDQKIAELNQRKYALKHTISQLEGGLSTDKISFDPDKAKALFEEVGIQFPDQIKIDFDQLVAFNEAITEERRAYIKEELEAASAETDSIEGELSSLNEKRRQSLEFLRSEDVFEKYRTLSAEVAKTAAEVDILKRQHNLVSDIETKRAELREARVKYTITQSEAEQELRRASSDRNGLLFKVRDYFSSTMRRVLGRDAILSVTLNGEGNLEFRTDFVDGEEVSTSESDGTSFKKLLCVVFDLSIIRAHLDGAFPKFVFHDGIFELLDPRPRLNLLEAVKAHTELGVQSIITVMDYDLPTAGTSFDAPLSSQDVILTLHDDGAKGRLFQFDRW